MSELLRAIVDELAQDPVALERLRDLVVGFPPTPEPKARASAYTPTTLAAELGRSPRAIRGAIARGELDAIKRGRGYVISADAVAAWANARPRAQNSAAPRPRPGTGPMRRALELEGQLARRERSISGVT